MIRIATETQAQVELEVTLKCADCGAELQGEWDGFEVLEVKPHGCNGFYTAAVEHEFRKKFGDEAADWLDLQKMLFTKE